MGVLALVSYGIAALGYLLLFLLILTVRTKSLSKALLLVTTLSTLFWCASQFLLQPHRQVWYFSIELLRYTCWFVFLHACISHFGSFRAFISQKTTLSILVVMVVATLVSVSQYWPGIEFGILTLAAISILVLTEILFRQAGDSRWAYKPLVIFIGATTIFDFVLYANAMMVQQISGTFHAARGLVHFAALPFLVMAIRRIKEWNTKIYISRDVIMHSSLLLLAGAYLVVMALVGYAVNLIGGEWDIAIQLALGFSALVLLATLFMSNQLRTKIKVFITKHFFANQYDYRERWVSLTHLLSKPSASELEAYQLTVIAFANAINYKECTLVAVEDRKCHVLAQTEEIKLTTSEYALVELLLPFLVEKHWLIDIKEALVAPHLYEGLVIQPELFHAARFQLVVPLFNQEKLWGLILLGKQQSSKVHLNWELRDYLDAVTGQVSNYIFHQKAATEVAENAQFAAFNRMSAFVVHDLKNVLAQIELILSNAERHKHNPEFIEDTFETLAHTKERMSKMLKQLTEKEVTAVEHASDVDLVELVTEVISSRCQNSLPVPTLNVKSNCRLDMDAERFANVLYHIIDNAQQATDAEGSVSVSIDQEEDGVAISIADTGVGMSHEFIQQRLFKPFDTTKGNAGMGVGAYDAKNFVEKMGGELIVDSTEGQGSTFTFRFPST